MEIKRIIEKTTKSFWGIPQEGYNLSAEVTRNGETLTYDLGFEPDPENYPVSRNILLNIIRWRLQQNLDLEVVEGDQSITGAAHLQNIGRLPMNSRPSGNVGIA